MYYPQKMGFPGGSAVNNLPAMQELQGDVGSIPGSGRSPGDGHGIPLPTVLPGESHR